VANYSYWSGTLPLSEGIHSRAQSSSIPLRALVAPSVRQLADQRAGCVKGIAKARALSSRVGYPASTNPDHGRINFPQVPEARVRLCV